MAESTDMKGRAGLLLALLFGVWRWRYLIVCFGIFGAMFGAFRSLTTPNQYRSAGKLFVRPGVRDVIVSEATLSGLDPSAARLSGSREAVLNEMQFLSSPELCELAVEHIGVDNLIGNQPMLPEGSADEPFHQRVVHAIQSWWWSAKSPDSLGPDIDRTKVATQIVKSSIVIVPEAGTSIISIFAFSHSPEQAQRILTGVLSAARQVHARAYDTMTGMDRVSEASSKSETEALEAERKLREFNQQKGVYDFETQLGELQSYVGTLDRQLDEFEIDAERIRKEIAAIDEILTDIPTVRIAPGSTSHELNPEFTALGSELDRLRQAELMLDLERGTQSSATIMALKESLQKRIQNAEERLRQTPFHVELPGREEENPDYARFTLARRELKVELAALTQRAVGVKALRDRSTGRLEQFEAMAPTVRQLTLDAAHKRAAASRFAESIANMKVVQRLEQLNISNVQVMQRATFDPVKISPNRPKSVMTAAIGGAAAGVLLAGMAAFLGTRIRNRYDVQRTPLPADAGVLCIPADLDPMAPPSDLPESLHDLAAETAVSWTRIPYDVADSRGVTVGVLPAGRTRAARAAAALALGLARHAGERVACISMYPDGGLLAGKLGAAPGAEQVPADGLPTCIPRLSLFASRSGNASTGAGPGLTALLARLRDEFRFIVIELQGLDVDPSGHAILRAIDGVQLAVTATKCSRRDVDNAQAAIESAGARTLGVLLYSPQTDHLDP